ncbi:MAG: hypothetical protein KKG59_01110 [Nanoarchaeota archaeon]|nr:hypothetical protein [Nanoarchaeota archaeon]
MKKGQVTIFVILGLIIVILVGLALFLKNSVTTPEDKPITVDKELEPLKEYIEECMYLTAKDAIIQIGLSGGYVDPIRADVVPIQGRYTEGPGILFPPPIHGETFDPETADIVPYWWYYDSGNNAKTNRPSLNYGPLSIETQLNEYIRDNLDECFDFLPWEQKGYEIKPKGNKVVKTTIAERNVQVDLDYEISVTLDGSELKMERYRTEVDVKLKNAYTLATRIFETIVDPEAPYLERLTLNVIGPYAMTENSEFPPLMEVVKTGRQRPKIWIEPQVQTKMEELLQDYVPLVHLQGARDNIVPIIINKDPTLQNFFLNFIMPIDKEGISDFHSYYVDFLYLSGNNGWPMHLKINDGGALMGDTIFEINFPMHMAITKYSFKYDISYPVLIRIHEDDAFMGEGYTFQMAYEVNIRRSKPLVGDFSMIEVDTGGTSLFCDEEQKKTGFITVKTKDAVSGQPLADVDLKFDCLAEACSMGTTQLSGGDAIWSGKFPICWGGQLVPTLEDYFGKSQPVSTVIDEPGEVTLELEEFKEIRLEVRKKEIGSNWVFLPDVQDVPLDTDESAMVILKRVPDGAESIHHAVGSALWNWTTPETVRDNLTLVSGKYTIQAYIYKGAGDGFYTEPKELCLAAGDCGGDHKVTLNMSMIGNLDLLENETIEITVEDLQKDKIIIYIPSVNWDDLNYITDLEVMADLKPKYYSYLDALKPKFE